MRVIAGRFGGRRLVAPKGRATRPTSDRVREAVFSMLEPLAGARVMDLFAGTGALGIEAISRGAAKAVFVERDRLARAALEANLKAVGLAMPEAEVRAKDAIVALGEAAERYEQYDVVFLDPPYARAVDLAERIGTMLGSVLVPGGRAVVESDRRGVLQLPLRLDRERRYGDTSIRIHVRDVA